MKAKFIFGAIAALAMTSCGGAGWSVTGTVNGAEKGTKMAVEAYNAGIWYVVDSVEIGNDGKFAYKANAPMPSIDILRLTLPGKGSVCFPVDSVDAITLDADAATFGTGHKLGGSDIAHTFAVVDSIAASTTDVAELQRKLAGFITTDTTGIVAYYTVGKSVGNTPVFNPADNLGNRLYGAATQVYAHYRPNDPRGLALQQAYFNGRQALGKIIPEAPEQVFEVEETGLIDIKRYDNKGVLQSLSEVAQKGKVVLLSFTDYSLPNSPSYNNILNDLYTLYSAKGFEIYQIAFDADEVSWKEAALNLPWITVWNSSSDGVGALASYNVGALPTTFIIDRKGDLGARVVDPADLPKQIAKYF